MAELAIIAHSTTIFPESKIRTGLAISLEMQELLRLDARGFLVNLWQQQRHVIFDLEIPTEIRRSATQVVIAVVSRVNWATASMGNPGINFLR